MKLRFALVPLALALSLAACGTEADNASTPPPAKSPVAIEGKVCRLVNAEELGKAWPQDVALDLKPAVSTEYECIFKSPDGGEITLFAKSYAEDAMKAAEELFATMNRPEPGAFDYDPVALTTGWATLGCAKPSQAHVLTQKESYVIMVKVLLPEQVKDFDPCSKGLIALAQAVANRV